MARVGWAFHFFLRFWRLVDDLLPTVDALLAVARDRCTTKRSAVIEIQGSRI